MAAGGGVEIGAWVALHLWKITTAVLAAFAALLSAVVRNRNNVIEANREDISTLRTSYTRQEAMINEMSAQIQELSTIKDKVLVLEAQMSDLGQDVKESSRDIKKLLANTRITIYNQEGN